jgi:hypothetical protein
VTPAVYSHVLARKPDHDERLDALIRPPDGHKCARIGTFAVGTSVTERP